MKILRKIRCLALLFIVAIQFTFIALPKVYAATTRVDLLTADNFAVLAGSAISDTVPTSVIIGDVGLDPLGGATITGLTCGEVTGTIYDNNGGYTGNGGGSTACRLTNAGLLTQAQNSLTTAYTDAANRSTTATIATQLGGVTLPDGVYDSNTGTFAISGLTPILTLDGQGNPDSVFIFKMATTLITASSSQVVLINGAQACNVYWQVGSAATFGTSTTLVGNVLALSAITDDGGSTVNGRLLARTAGAITLSNTHVTKQNCAAGTSGGPAIVANSNSNSGVSSSVVGSSGIPFCPTLNNVPPIIIESKRINENSISINWGPYSGTDKFIVQYGLENGKWLYSTNVTGFSTTINDLPPNQPIWVRVAARNDCSIGNYGESKLVGGPSLPNTGFAPREERNLTWYIPFISYFLLKLI